MDWAATVVHRFSPVRVLCFLVLVVGISVVGIWRFNTEDDVSLLGRFSGTDLSWDELSHWWSIAQDRQES